MAESSIFFDGFSLVNQPVIFISRDCIEYMNPAAVELAGRDLTGKHCSMLLPPHVLNVQAECFASTAFIGTKSCAVNIRSDGKSKICVLTPPEQQVSDNSMIFARLRSSLSNIRFASSCISILGENSNDEKLLSYVSSLNRSYNSIKRTVDNMSTLEMLQKGQLPFCAEAFDATLVCSDIIDTLSFMLGRQDLAISLHAAEHIRIVADRRLFEQLLMNLLSNSVAHCGSGGRISVSLLRTDRHLVLGVSDNGSGIEPRLLPGIFERYLHNNALSEANRGSGMGLAIVRGIAELHDGAVIIESRGAGTGTSVRVMLSTELSPANRFHDVSDYSAEELNSFILTEFSDVLPEACYSGLMDD